ncbi:hypothetical protein HPB52_008919 [Rhipicephalus sanguineus]|uniref:Uncharacterized protein n=1 Tax=Rhipicephalus sanguineus TaxID=34632 RepID=A0A9D4SYA8_RHISA|nr:hypothetical protein HPB52_008919 [Rhipicephalus sanguineus]
MDCEAVQVWYSVILLTVVDHRYCFRYMNAGAPGRRHDAYVYGRSWLCQKIERGLLSFPVAIIEHYPRPYRCTGELSLGEVRPSLPAYGACSPAARCRSRLPWKGTTSPLRNSEGSPFSKHGKTRERNHTQPASRERNEAGKRSVTLLYDTSQLRAGCRRCYALTIESSYNRAAASTRKPAARTGFSPH